MIRYAAIAFALLYLFGGSVRADAPMQATVIWTGRTKQETLTKFQDGACTLYLFRSTISGSDGAVAMVAGPGCR
jgi:hypothetical protein